MNPFAILKEVQDAYRTYVHTFQRFKNQVIHNWVMDKVEKGTLLWKDPYIQLNRRFKKGEPLEELVKAGLLHPGVLSCFTKEQGNRKAPTISPHKHQTRAIKHLLEDKANTIVATGTGSGKSFCFGIPIVSECLRMKEQGVNGIKAVIIYPMDALANSQYDDFARRLGGSGLRIGLYTGDTDTSDDEAHDNY